MLNITLKGLPPFDGTYALDFTESFTKRELHWVKEIAGVRVGELADAFDKGDSDLIVAFTVIALVRNGKVTKEQVRVLTDMLMDAPDEAMDFIYEPDEAKDDADPPVTQPPPTNGGDERTRSSSEDSNGGGDARQVTDLASTGAQP